MILGIVFLFQTSKCVSLLFHDFHCFSEKSAINLIVAFLNVMCLFLWILPSFKISKFNLKNFYYYVCRGSFIVLGVQRDSWMFGLISSVKHNSQSVFPQVFFLSHVFSIFWNFNYILDCITMHHTHLCLFYFPWFTLHFFLPTTFQFSNFTFMFAQIAVKPIFRIQFYFLYFLNNFLIDYHLLVNYLILSSFTFLFPLFCSSISLQAFRLFPQASEFPGSLHRDEESGGQEVNEDGAPSSHTHLLAPVINNQPWQNSHLAKDVYKNEKTWRFTASKSTCSSSTHA